MNVPRDLMQHRPWLPLILVGSHHLEEMRQEFWHPFLSIGKVIQVSYLGDEEARQLLAYPWDDFPVNYDPEGDPIGQIVRQCGGQPLLLQAVGYQVVERVNGHLRTSGPQTRPLATLEDAQAAIEHVLAHGEYFTALYEALQPEAQSLLRAIAMGQNQPGKWVSISSEQIGWRELTLRSLVRESDKGVCIAVDLLRRWLRKR